MSFKVCSHGRDLRDGCIECKAKLVGEPVHDNILRCVHGAHFHQCDKCNESPKPLPPPALCCDHDVPLIYECRKCFTEAEIASAKRTEDKLQLTGKVINDYDRSMTPHQFSCAILDKLNANIKVETVEVRTLCLMVQEQATQLRTIREVTNQGVRSGRVVG